MFHYNEPSLKSAIVDQSGRSGALNGLVSMNDSGPSELIVDGTKDG